MTELSQDILPEFFFFKQFPPIRKTLDMSASNSPKFHGVIHKKTPWWQRLPNDTNT